MNGKSLGRLQRVELRECWESESGDFTPWLANEENISLLGEAIGLELEVESQEKTVGPFRADILCRETTTGNWVLIENQIEKTDHKHLGQLLTYAAGLDAVSVVWIANSFVDEHRATIDWLNRITDERFSFFGLEVELWRIGDSPLAPKFNIVSKPNDWTKVPPKVDPSGLSETKLLQKEYWTALREYILNRKSFLKHQKPLPQHWTNLSIGRAYFHLVARVNTVDKVIAIYLCIHGPDKLPHFRLIHANKDDIEYRIGETLQWRELPGKKESQILLEKNDVNVSDKSDWPNQHKWLCDKLEAFHRVFSPIVKSLDASEYIADNEE